MSRSTRPLRGLTIGTAAVAAATLALSSTAHAASTTERVEGENRYETSVAISQRDFEADGSADAVVLARGDAFADALTGGALAIDKEAPLLLTYPNRLPGSTSLELARVLGEDGTVYLLGGTSAISDAVAETVEELGYEVERLEGENRYETAVAIAEEIEPDGPLLVGTGTNFPDALTAGGAAGYEGGAVLLSNGARLPSVISDYIQEFEGAIYAVGGPAAAALADTRGVTDLSGDDRYETAVAVAGEFFPLEEADTEATFALASGEQFPDALAGAASSGREGYPVLLTRSDHLPGATSAYIREISEGRTLLGIILGGEKAISEAVVTAVNAALNPPADEDDDTDPGDDDTDPGDDDTEPGDTPGPGEGEGLE